MKKTLLVVLCLVMVLVMFVGCQKAATPAEPADKPADDAPAADAPAADAPAADGDYSDVSIVMIPKLLNNYFTTADKGFQEAAKELGFTYEYMGPQSGDATSQIEFLEAAIQKKVDVICISPNSNDALNSIFDEAREAGIKIVIFNQDLTGYEEHRDVAVMPTDFSLVGPSQLETIGMLTDYEGEFAIMSAATDTPDQNYWIDELKKVLESDSKYAKMTLVEVAYGDEDPQKTTTECEALLTKYPDLKCICAPTAVGLPICAQVVETKGLSGKIAVTGLAQPNDTRAYVKSGTVKEFGLWNPGDEGYLAATYCCQLVKGEVGTEPGTKFTAGRLGDFEITADGQIITGPLFAFNAENIDDFDF